MRGIHYIVIGIILAVFGFFTFYAGVAQGVFTGHSTSSNPYYNVVGDAVIGVVCLILGPSLIVYGTRRRKAEKANPPSPPK